MAKNVCKETPPPKLIPKLKPILAVRCWFQEADTDSPVPIAGWAVDNQSGTIFDIGDSSREKKPVDEKNAWLSPQVGLLGSQDNQSCPKQRKGLS